VSTLPLSYLIEKIPIEELADARVCDTPRFMYGLDVPERDKYAAAERELLVVFMDQVNANMGKQEPFASAYRQLFKHHPVFFRSKDQSLYVLNGHHRDALGVLTSYNSSPEAFPDIWAFVVSATRDMNVREQLSILYSAIDGKVFNPYFNEDHLVWDAKDPQPYYANITDTVFNGYRPTCLDDCTRIAQDLTRGKGTVDTYLDNLMRHYRFLANYS
jgi:hypothetical protein